MSQTIFQYEWFIAHFLTSQPPPHPSTLHQPEASNVLQIYILTETLVFKNNFNLLDLVQKS